VSGPTFAANVAQPAICVVRPPRFKNQEKRSTEIPLKNEGF